MLKIAIVLGLATVALAIEGIEVVRFGTVGSRYSVFKGLVVPYTKHVVEGIPSFELKRMVKGVPVHEDELINFRCHHLDEHLVPIESSSRPVFLCRNLHWTGDTKVTDDKMAFLFSADELRTIPTRGEIDLWAGTGFKHDLLSGVYTKVLDDTTEHVIRVGSIGTNFAHLKGLLIPYTKHVVEGVPAYEFRGLVNGIAKHEEELVHFRCGLLEKFYVPIETVAKPVYMCRYGKIDHNIPITYKKSFLFSAEKFNVEPGKKVIDLWLGKNMWHDYISDVYTTTFLDEVLEHEIHLSNIGTRFIDWRGVLMPYTHGGVVDGIPAYEFRRIVKGVPVEEHDLTNFRCTHLDEFFLPIETTPKPVFLCRNIKWTKDKWSEDKKFFLFSAEHLDISPTIRTFDLWFGDSLWGDVLW